MDVEAIVQGVTFGIALLGAVLGVVNLWWTLRKDTVRLKIRRVFVYPVVARAGLNTIGVEVINVGYLPVTLNEVGFTTKSRGSLRMPILGDFFESTNLPIRMEPRTEITIRADPTALSNEKVQAQTHIYAKTACGLYIKQRMKG